MAKKQKKKTDKHKAPAQSGGSSLSQQGGEGGIPLVVPPSISKRGWKLIASGIATVIVGFSVLTLADARGENWASSVSALLIVAGYATIGVGIMVKDPSKLSSPLPRP